MLINEFELKLKDGRSALVRSPREEDIPGMLEYLYLTAAETIFLLRYPEECGRYTEEGERALFERINNAPNEAMAVCLVDGRIAGVCNVSWSTRIKMKHRAEVAIAVLKEYWGQGIGSALLGELIRTAEANEEILQIELAFIEGNHRARALYEKLGFRITGVTPNAIRLKDGTLLNEYYMIRTVKGRIK